MTESGSALASVHAPHVQASPLRARRPAGGAVYMSHGVAASLGCTRRRTGTRYAEASPGAVREGFLRVPPAQLQASPMGRPVYERMGFITPSEYRVLVGTL